MRPKHVSLQLDGQVSLTKFSEAVLAWNQVLQALVTSVQPNGGVPILLHDLAFGSATIAVEVVLKDDQTESVFTSKYRSFGLDIRDGRLRDLPKSLREPARKLLEVAAMEDGVSMSLSSDDDDILIFANAREHMVVGMNKNNEEHRESLGIVTGRLQSISSRGKLRITVYDVLNDRAIRCFLSDKQRDQARELWDQIVEIEGIIRRDPASGYPMSVKQVRRIALAQNPNAKERWMNAGGVLRRLAPNVPSEVLIRRLRDA